MAYILSGELLCDTCGSELAELLTTDGAVDIGDSESFPQEWNGDASDSVHYCANGENCTEATEHSVDGSDRTFWVGGIVTEALTDDGITAIWAEHDASPSELTRAVIEEFRLERALVGAKLESGADVPVDDDGFEGNTVWVFTQNCGYWPVVRAVVRTQTQTDALAAAYDLLPDADVPDDVDPYESDAYTITSDGRIVDVADYESIRPIQDSDGITLVWEHL